MDFVEETRRKLSELPKERLLDYIEMQFKNLWTLQNNWMVRVDEKFGADVAIELDGMCYGRMSEVGAYRAKKFFNLGDDIESMLTCLQYLPPEPGSEGEWFRTGDNKAVWRCTKCAMQLARRERGAPELPCKQALIDVMDKTFKAVNPKAKVIRSMAPPDPHPEDLWCEVEFEIEY